MSIAGHQLLGLTQACVGLVLLARPQVVLNDCAWPDSHSARRIARLLGTRLGLQGTAVGLSGSALVFAGAAALASRSAAPEHRR